MSESTCPICGTSVLAWVYSKSLQGKVTLPPDEDMTVVAYRCQNGHIYAANEQAPGDDWRSERAA